MIINLEKSELNKIVLNQNSRIKDAINIIKKNKFRIVLVVNKNERLLGTITNGDIRRNLLSGLDLNDPAIYVTNKKPVYISKTANIKKVDKLMIRNKILSIPIVDGKKKIIGLHHRNIKKKYTSNTSVIIMAGGKGKRLLPLTKNCPKAMLKINGKPMIENLMLKTKSFGYKKFILSVNYLSSKITKYFQNGKKLKIDISYIKENKPLGTVGSLSLLDKNSISKNFILTNCDVITNINILDLEEYHKNHKAFITVAAHIRKSKIEYGVLETNGVKLKNFSEKPILNHYINAGVYVLNKKVLDYISLNKRFDLPELLNIGLKLNKKIIVYPIYESWTDVGIIKELKYVRNK